MRDSKPKGVPLGAASENATEEGAFAAQAPTEESLGREPWALLERSERTPTRARLLERAGSNPSLSASCTFGAVIE